MPKENLNDLLNAVAAYTAQVPNDTPPENYAYRLGCANGILVAISKLVGADISASNE